MPKRANEDPQEDGATRAPALRLSDNFQSSSADIELRSKDGVRFLVHKANLAVSSTVFADMFATASSDSGGERPSIELQESAEILERLLPYCYPSVVPIWQHDAVKDLQFIRAIDKYMIPRAIEAGRSNMHALVRHDDRRMMVDFRPAYDAFAFARMFSLHDLARKSFTFLLASIGHGQSDRDISWMVSSPEGATLLPLVDRDRLAIFLGMLALHHSSQCLRDSEDHLAIVSAAADVFCEESEVWAPDPAEEVFHPLCREAVQIWQRQGRLPIAAWYEEDLPHLSAPDMDLSCPRCRESLARARQTRLLDFQTYEKRLGLRFSIKDGGNYYAEYQAWVRRRYGEE